MSFCFLYNVVLENHSVENSPWEEGGLLAAHGLQIGNHNIPTKYTMHDGRENIVLGTVDSEKGIGVIIDTKLTFRDHISSKIKLANRNLGIIFWTFTFSGEETFLHLYNSLVRPHLEYSTPNCSPSVKK